MTASLPLADFALRTIPRRFSREEKTELLFYILTVYITTGNFEKAISRLKRKKQNIILSDNSKKKKTFSSCREKWLNEKFFRLSFARFENFFAVRQRQKEKKTKSKHEKSVRNFWFFRLDYFANRKRQNMFKNIEFKIVKPKFIR